MNNESPLKKKVCACEHHLNQFGSRVAIPKNLEKNQNHFKSTNYENLAVVGYKDTSKQTTPPPLPPPRKSLPDESGSVLKPSDQFKQSVNNEMGISASVETGHREMIITSITRWSTAFRIRKRMLWITGLATLKFLDLSEN